MGKRHTLVHQIADWAEQRPDQPAIHGKTSSGSWKTYTWGEYYQTVRRVGRGLIALGVKHGECVALVGDNRPEWVLSQFGTMGIGCIPAPIYPTNTPSQVAHILNNSESRIAICDGAEQMNKYLEIHNSGMAKLEKIVTMDPISGQDPELVISFDQLLALGDGVEDAEFTARLEAVDPEKPALLIYTSGTTGVAKGVQLTNKGLVLIGKALVDRFPEFRDPGRYVVISYLPLCHAAEQLFTNLMHLDTGGQCYFCGDLKQIKDFLTEVRPTVFLGVPRVWEKFEAALRSKLGAATGIKAKLASWAMRTELAQFKRSVDAGQEISTFSRRLANKLVIGKVKAALGLDRLVVAATGSAPISVATQEFFASLGICIYEGYGMSETTGVATVTRPDKPRFGTVGTPLDGVEVKIGEDGEILLKGETMTHGYLRMPDETAELLDADGWLHTGDLGSIDGEGNLKITGRKKDLLITAGGKNVAPAEMEAYIKRVPGVGQAVVVGDRQPYLCALITLDEEGLPDLTTRLGIQNGSLEKVASDPKVRDYLQDGIERECNANVARYQTIKKFEVLKVAFSVDGGELTPTMKIKRNVVNEKYRDVIDGLYTE